ncbi:hypothetical protein [uncultured Tateyamaria sp.]|uniref:cupredoxin domain-containing protein n=1 Tax=uncultured Tateyamaria sp. TaxID=455651 RepID=UPI0026080C72|nr:hypothetical protein [uncultured Tateyamaria sp.]
MKRAITLLATVATLASATAAQAAEHTILILPDAYFPAVTYVNDGDTVRFNNQSGAQHTIIAKNNSWELGPITNGATVSLQFNKGDQNEFYNKNAKDSEGNYVVVGTVSFATAPLN